jgi:hypothetical protein
MGDIAMTTPEHLDDSCPLLGAKADHHPEVERLSRLIGHAPDPTTQREGAGLLGVVATIHADLQEIKDVLAGMVEAQKRRRALAIKLGFAAIVPVFAAIVAAVVHYLEGFHR